MKSKLIATLALLALALTPSRAGTARFDFIFDHYSTADGLPHDNICDIRQDSRGYIWIATWYGLSRYDGDRFVNYTIRSGEGGVSAHNRILTIDEDAAGYLWLTTYDNRLVRFDPLTETFVSIPDALSGFSDYNAKVTAFHNDSSSNVWVGVHDGGLYRIRPDLSYVKILHAGRNVTGIYETSSGDIFISSEKGLSRVTADTAVLLAESSPVNAFSEFGSTLYFATDDALVVVTKPSVPATVHRPADGDAPGDPARTPDLAAGWNSGWSSEASAESIGFDASDLGRLTTMTVTGSNGRRSLWLGFSGGAIASVDTTALRIRPRHMDMGRVRYLFPDDYGLLWIVTDRTGIYSYNTRNRRFRHYVHQRNVTSYYTDTLACVKSRGDMTWIKMNDYGFGLYDRQRDEIIPLNNVPGQSDCRFPNGVACYETDSDGILWMSTTDRGLERVTPISPNVDIIVPPTASSDRSASEIRAIRRDSGGNVWVAAKSGEIYRYNADMTSCVRLPESFGLVYCIFEDADGNLWFGTKGDGLVKMILSDDGSYVLRTYRHDPDDPRTISSDDIYSIEQDTEGKLWFGTFGGGISMLEDPDDTDFDTVMSSFPAYPVDYADRVRFVHLLPSGRMLVATVGGLLSFDPCTTPRGTRFEFVKDWKGASAIGNNDVIHIFSDSAGRTFLSTFGGGLYCLTFDPEGNPSVRAVDTSSGLASDMVFSAVEDRDGHIWLTTALGISKVDGSTLKVTNFTRYDGIIPTTFSEAAAETLSDGTILFGSLNNIYRIDPDTFSLSDETARLVVSGVTVDGRRVPLSGRIVIPHNYSYFRVEFASLNYSIGSGLNCSYMLRGYDKTWLTSSAEHEVSYSHIPQGHYRFIVSTGDGAAAGQSAAIDIRVRPSIWTCTIARILYILLALAILIVIWRTVVSSSRLRSNIRMEKDLNDAKVRFFTNISHELRTPLTLIIGGIDDIRKHTPEGDRNEYSVGLVEKNADRMMRLVNELLDIRAVVNGKIRLKVSQIDIVELLRQVYDNFKDMAAERRMEMRLTHSVDRLMVWGDAMRLEALIYNLFSNAYKYTADGGLIEGAIYYREGDPDFTIMVSDNGVGVPKEKQSAIFEPFIRASDTVYKGLGSSGIGLSFCKEITDMHGGRIWVESEKGKGSRFFVRLPIDRDHFSEEVAEFVDSDPSATLADSERGLAKYRVTPTYPEGAVKVLLVEDNAELRVYMYNSLVDRYEVRDAANGREALSILASNWIPDIIATDYMMPEMNGIELINHIRNDFETSHLPVIMFTAKHETDTHLKAMKYGADGYISKPFTMELFIARIENLLERRHQLVRLMAANPGEGGSRGFIRLTPDEVVITDRDEELIKKVKAWLEENIADTEITVDMLATHVGMGRTSLYNKIKGLTGKSPVELIQDFRMEKATYYLKVGQLSVSEISYKVGFSDPGYFSRTFKKHFGVSPSDYIKSNRS